MSEGKSAVYEIKNTTPAAVEAMLGFVYTGELPAVDWLAPVFELAVQYELASLAKFTAEKMLEEVSVSNVKTFARVLKLHSTVNGSANDAFDALLHKIKDSLREGNLDLLRASY